VLYSSYPLISLTFGVNFFKSFADEGLVSQLFEEFQFQTDPKRTNWQNALQGQAASGNQVLHIALRGC